jgi:hypothetical protein
MGRRLIALSSVIRLLAAVIVLPDSQLDTVLQTVSGPVSRSLNNVADHRRPNGRHHRMRGSVERPNRNSEPKILDTNHDGHST